MVVDTRLYAFVKTHRTVHHKMRTLMYSYSKKIIQDLGGFQDARQTLTIHLTANVQHNLPERDEEKGIEISNFGIQGFECTV